MLMLDEPEVAQRILDKMVAFELEYYRRILEAGNGRIDLLRPPRRLTALRFPFCSVWRCGDNFSVKTQKTGRLSPRIRSLLQQHSCGAIRPLIPELISCGVDVLEPIQKVQGLEPESLQEEFGGKITFHGGIDTQGLLPYGTPEQVRTETRRFIETLGQNGGYILMASQAFEGDVPIENIEAVYETERKV